MTSSQGKTAARNTGAPAFRAIDWSGIHLGRVPNSAACRPEGNAQGAESRAQPAAPSVGRPAACRLFFWHAKPLILGVCSLH